jgi:hypothetical protein
MEILFQILQTASTPTISPEHASQALEIYCSGLMPAVHAQIRTFITNHGVIAPVFDGEAEQEVIRLIFKHRPNMEEEAHDKPPRRD